MAVKDNTSALKEGTSDVLGGRLPPWQPPRLLVLGEVREIVLASTAKGSPEADSASMGDNFKNTTSTN